MADGFDVLQAKLEALKGDSLKRAERKALRAVGELVQAAIVERAPVRPHLPSGTALPVGALKEDIRATVHVASDDRAATDVSRVTIGPGKATAHVARWVEFGHGPNTPAHPFIRPAADATEQAGVATYAEVMTGEVKKAMNQ